MDSDKDQPEIVPAEQRKKSGPPPSKRKRSRGKGASSRRQDARRREDTFEADRIRGLADKYSIDSALAALVKDCCDVPDKVMSVAEVTTRGVAFGLTESYRRVLDQYPAKVPQVCTIHEAYRAVVLQHTVKLQEATNFRPLGTAIVDDTVVSVPADVSSYTRPYTETFNLVANAISAHGNTQLGGGVTPSLSEDFIDEDGDLQPSPFRITAMNLRDVVVALTEEGRSTRRTRREFFRRNPLPGANWDDNNFLLNADEVCPPDWPGFRGKRDLERYSALLTMCKSKSMAIVSPLDYSPDGSGGLVVTRYIPDEEEPGMIPLDWRNEPLLLPRSSMFHSSVVVPGSTFACGALALAAECNSVTEDGRRDRQSAVQRKDLDIPSMYTRVLRSILKG